MKRSVINFALTITLALILSQFLPWWSAMIAGFLSALFVRLKRGSVFFVPFLAILLYWMIYAFLLSQPNDFILAQKIATLFPLGGNVFLLVVVTGIIGGLAAGFAALFGNQLSVFFKS